MDDLLKKAMPARSNVEAVLSATGELGMASGLDAAVKVMRALAEDGPRVDASEIRAAAMSLEASAEKKRRAAKAVLAKY